MPIREDIMYERVLKFLDDVHIKDVLKSDCDFNAPNTFKFRGFDFSEILMETDCYYNFEFEISSKCEEMVFNYSSRKYLGWDNIKIKYSDLPITFTNMIIDYIENRMENLEYLKTYLIKKIEG